MNTSNYTQRFSLKHIHDIIKAVCALLSHTNTKDYMSLLLLKLTLSAETTSLSQIFRTLIDNSFSQTGWKVGQTEPIFKKGIRYDYASYRPIMLLPLLSKAIRNA